MVVREMLPPLPTNLSPQPDNARSANRTPLVDGGLIIRLLVVVVPDESAEIVQTGWKGRTGGAALPASLRVISAGQVLPA